MYSAPHHRAVHLGFVASAHLYALLLSASKLRYVQLMSDYKCVKQIQQQTQAFLRGLSDVVPLQWLQMFSAEELQHLVSGTSEGITSPHYCT